MSQISFNLIDEPWIPVTAQQGVSRDVGLLELFRSAPSFKEIADPSPLVTAALHRLCLAILHRVFGPRSLAEWTKLWTRGSFDISAIEDYLNGWRDRFDLFHDRYPFYQLHDYDTGKPNYLSKLAHEMATGNNQTLFDHRFEEESPALPPAQAARLVVSIQSFGIGFGVSPTRVNGRNVHFTDGPLVRGALSWLVSDNLFRTLLLNLVRYDGKDQPVPSSSADRPRWEKADQPLEYRERMPDGYLDLLTWQCRAIRLVPETDGAGHIRVRRVHYGQGDKLHSEAGPDPFFACKADDRSGWVTIKISPHRQIWRDSTALLNVFEQQRFRPCLPLKQLYAIDVANRGLVDVPVSLRVAGLATEAGKAGSILLWRFETLPFSLDLLRFEDNIHAVEEAVRLAEDVGAALRNAVWVMAFEMLKSDEESDPKREDVAALAAVLSRETRYWASLNEPFEALLLQHQGPRKAMEDWRRTLREAAVEALRLSESVAGVTARAYRARARSSAFLHARLHALLDGKEAADAA